MSDESLLDQLKQHNELLERHAGEPQHQPVELYHGPMVEALLRLRQSYDPAQRRSPDDALPICWRTLEGVPLCQEHGDDLVKTGFTTLDELRSVWDDTTIEHVAASTGQRLDDLHQLHGRFYAQTCAMCGVFPTLNRCLNCNKVLHPQWPAVYCSNRCAYEDA